MTSAPNLQDLFNKATPAQRALIKAELDHWSAHLIAAITKLQPEWDRRTREAPDAAARALVWEQISRDIFAATNDFRFRPMTEEFSTMITKLDLPTLCDACNQEAAKALNSSLETAGVLYESCPHLGVLAAIHHYLENGRRIIVTIDLTGPGLTKKQMQAVVAHATAAAMASRSSMPTPREHEVN
jgi:hypothetical protein